jgi:hypothetical protein
MTNSTSVTCPLLLAFLLLTPQASLARRYGWIGGAYWFRFWRNVDTPSSIALHKIDDGDMAIRSETNETIEKKKAAMNPTLGPRYQYSQYDRLRVPIAVDVLFAHATGGYRPGPGRRAGWQRRHGTHMDWWRIRGPSKRLRLRVQ